jgi:hypothetical protein
LGVSGLFAGAAPTRRAAAARKSNDRIQLV